MKTPAIIVKCATERDLRQAVEILRAKGIAIDDVYTPHALHGLDRQLGWPPSRLGWICFACGALGFGGMMWFQQWTAAVDWPINVGGKPWNSWPAELPVAFEAMVFLAGFGTVLSLLAACGLVPGRRPRLPPARVTDDEFAILLSQRDATIDAASMTRLLPPAPGLAVLEWSQHPEHLSEGNDQ
jgi:hypothetical protein